MVEMYIYVYTYTYMYDMEMEEVTKCGLYSCYLKQDFVFVYIYLT